ncbi:hypothetical protein VTH06DRAFT_2852 [Thermothelomyces fergusii]
MAAIPQAFYCQWQVDAICERLFELLPKEDICSVRLVNSACCNLVTKSLFLRAHLTFSAKSLTKESRIEVSRQYPPLFHAATNVPSFINAPAHMTNMRDLTIQTPGQNPLERYRRDIVDYALIRLGVSVERAPLTNLSKLTLSGVHPFAFNYLRYAPGLGALSSVSVRWRQIRKLFISVESWDFYGPSPGLNHLMIIDDYITEPLRRGPTNSPSLD